MKTAISIPDDVFEDADQLASRLRTSRSELYTRAVREYLAKHEPNRVTDALDALYAQEDAGEDGFATTVGSARLEASEW